MSAYLQRLFDRSVASPALGQVTPAGPSRSPVAEADQRLNEPGLADLFSFTGSPGPGEIDGLETLAPEAAAPAPPRPQPRSQRPAPPAPAAPRDTIDAARAAPQDQAAEMRAAAPRVARPPFRSVGAVAPEDFVPPEPTGAVAPMPPEPAPATARAPAPTSEPHAVLAPGAAKDQAPSPQSAFVTPPDPEPPPAPQAEPKTAQAPSAPRPQPLREIIREVIRAETPRPQAPTPRRPMTAAEASAIGPLTAEPRARTLFGLRKR